MKKGLSVLLIAAALFGFYGGAVSINDVLACKDYWEKEGEKSTADMNKLEDGLNQLKDNEQAYLDGLETLAEGEKTLADGEAQYAQGLADYKAAPGKLADGEAELAAGYAEYNEGKKKLADGRKKLAEAKVAIADGEEALAGLQKLIDGIGAIISGYTKQGTPTDPTTMGWDQTLSLAKSGIAQLQQGVSAGSTKLKGLSSFAENKTEYEKSIDAIAAATKVESQSEYDNFKKNAHTLDTQIASIQTNVKALYNAAEDLNNKYPASAPTPEEYDALFKEYVVNNFASFTALKEVSQPFYNMAKDIKDGTVKATDLTPKGVTYAVAIKAGLNEMLDTTSTTSLVSINYAVNEDTSDTGIPTLKDNLSLAVTAIAGLQGGQSDMAAGIKDIATAFTTTDALIEGVKKAFPGRAGEVILLILKGYASGGMENLTFDDFKAQMEAKNTGVLDLLNQALPVLRQAKTNGTNELAAGKAAYEKGKKDLKAGEAELAAGAKKLAAGEAKLAQGYADYEAAPGKLADAEKQLADGRQQLADGKKKLAEYEDGEQQVRDGLATLMGTEADLDLESILDRRNGDDNFDDPNGHLQLDEGLDAVKSGREYQADDGVLITKEITARAIGTVGCLAAAALAILAGVLSLLKKYKAAAVSAVLTAIAGGVGIAQGMSAGEYFSSIAGSTVGNTPFIAAGVLAAVAAVFAIVNFTAKKEEA